jgi:hypothetical protein
LGFSRQSPSGWRSISDASAASITADLILRGNSDLIDATQLGVERFKEGRWLEETAIL